MGIEQHVAGRGILLFGCIAFAYYSVWVLSGVRIRSTNRRVVIESSQKLRTCIVVVTEGT